ncbi:hypothetical protein [Sediminibacter sp. Hel_I_10]|uniref:hypothetical protein n=1 Tax=Sediminibacter sp. Hel_I_10 TaxID=1392490 RepID=UPI000478BFE1|nr:hypothetical protein [Sediminibacter sp. Hel_I_10]
MAKTYSKKSSTNTAKSGAKIQTKFDKSSDEGIRKGFITAWKVADGVMHSYKVIFPKDREVKITATETGHHWLPVTVIQSAAMKQNVIVGGMLDLANQKVYIKEWNWVINPKASNGGYCGKHISKDYN